MLGVQIEAEADIGKMTLCLAAKNSLILFLLQMELLLGYHLFLGEYQSLLALLKHISFQEVFLSLIKVIGSAQIPSLTCYS